MTELSKAELAKHDRELRALKDKSTFHYVGYNVIRTAFELKADADRFLELMRLLGRAGPYHFYGAECAPCVQSNGPGKGWEVYYG